MTFNSNGHPFDLYKDECRVLMEHRYKKSCPKQKVGTQLSPQAFSLAPLSARGLGKGGFSAILSR